MKLDCVKASDLGFGKGWVVINMENGGIVHHDADTDSEYAWMGAAEVLAEAISGQQQGRFDLFAQVPHMTFPGGKHLRSPLLALGMLWHRLKELL